MNKPSSRKSSLAIGLLAETVETPERLTRHGGYALGEDCRTVAPEEERPPVGGEAYPELTPRGAEPIEALHLIQPLWRAIFCLERFCG